jgi:hypothetical protein
MAKTSMAKAKKNTVDGRGFLKGAAAGAEGAAFLQRPFSADSLGRKIRQMLSRA